MTLVLASGTLSPLSQCSLDASGPGQGDFGKLPTLKTLVQLSLASACHSLYRWRRAFGGFCRSVPGQCRGGLYPRRPQTVPELQICGGTPPWPLPLSSAL